MGVSKRIDGERLTRGDGEEIDWSEVNRVLEEHIGYAFSVPQPIWKQAPNGTVYLDSDSGTAPAPEFYVSTTGPNRWRSPEDNRVLLKWRQAVASGLMSLILVSWTLGWPWLIGSALSIFLVVCLIKWWADWDGSS